VTYNTTPVGWTNSNDVMPHIFTDIRTLTPDSTYTYQIFVRNTPTTCGLKRSYTEPPVQPVSSGLRLLIAKSTVSDAILNNVTSPDAYDDNAPGYQEISIKRGNQFKLKSNVDPDLKSANYNSCSGTVDPPTTGITGLWGNNINGGLTTMNTTNNVPTGSYTFTLTCTKTLGADPKTSTATLKIISSSIKEI
jgi:hypothetical protein